MLNRSPEKLHRLSDNKNDWDDLPDSQLNVWQKIAKKTRGVATAANGITIAGSALVISGLLDFMNGDQVSGTAKVAAGRLADVIDGTVANATGTKGKVGRTLDPTADMVQLGVALPLLHQHEVMPLAAAVAVGAPKVLNTAGSVIATLRKREVNPTEEGKLGTAALWAGIGAFMLKAAFDKHIPGAADVGLEAVGWAGAVGGSVYQLPATIEYLRLGFGPQSTEQDKPKT